MRRKNILSGTAWEPKVGYSRAVRVGSSVFISGTTATGEDGKLTGKGDLYAQTKQALANIEKALDRAGATLQDVVRTRLFLTDISQWEAAGKAHGEVFGKIQPATTMVQVARLIDPDMLIEIEAEALVGASLPEQDTRSAKILKAEYKEEVVQVKDLMEQYFAAQGNEGDFKDYNHELSNLTAEYQALFLATYDGEPAGCVAMKKIDNKVCEMKRQFVRPEYRGQGIGRALAKKVIDEARRLGYTRVRLDTAKSMKNAMLLYYSLGYKDAVPYKSVEGDMVLELELA